MSKLLKPFILGTLIIFSFTGCGEIKNKKTLEIGSLENTSWLLVQFSDQELQGSEITLNFETEKLNGKAVCNSYFSRYFTVGNEITVEPIGATRKLCLENSKLETDYFSFFSKTSEYGIQENFLILKNDLGTLEFKKRDTTTSNIILREEALGIVPLSLRSKLLIEGFKGLFPYANVSKNTVQLEDGIYEQVVVKESGELLKGTFSADREKLKRLEVVSDEIRDQFGVQVGMDLQKAKVLRPSIEIETDHHFHTYAMVEDSNIRYELCCNQFQPDKVEWTYDEVKDWRVKAIIWERG